MAFPSVELIKTFVFPLQQLPQEVQLNFNESLNQRRAIFYVCKFINKTAAWNACTGRV